MADPKPLSERKKPLQTAFRLQPDMLERLDAFCKTQRVRTSRNKVVEAAINEFLDSVDPSKQPKNGASHS
jgi:predicted DNA-binding protein